MNDVMRVSALISQTFVFSDTIFIKKPEEPRDVVVAYQTDGEVEQRFTAIQTVIGNRSQEVLDHCEAHIAYIGNNYFPFLQDFYKSHRATLFRFLEVVPLRSSTQDTSLVEAINFIRSHRSSRNNWLLTIQTEHPNTLDKRQIQLLDLTWVPTKWWYLVTGQRQRTPYPTQIDHRQFEVCVFSHILSICKLSIDNPVDCGRVPGGEERAVKGAKSDESQGESSDPG